MPGANGSDERSGSKRVGRLPVDRDHVGLQPVEAQAHDARIARIREPEPDAASRTRLDLEGNRLAVHGEPVAEPPDGLRGEWREGAVLLEPPIVDQDRLVAIDRWRVLLLDDQEARQTALQGLRASAREAGPDQEGAGIGRGQTVIELAAGRDRLLRQVPDAVHRVGAANAMEMEGQRQGSVVLEGESQLLPGVDPQDRTQPPAKCPDIRILTPGAKAHSHWGGSQFGRNTIPFETLDEAWRRLCLGSQRDTDESGRDAGCEGTSGGHEGRAFRLEDDTALAYSLNRQRPSAACFHRHRRVG